MSKSFQDSTKSSPKIRLEKVKYVLYTGVNLNPAAFFYKTTANFFEDESCPETLNKQSRFRNSSVEMNVSKIKLFGKQKNKISVVLKHYTNQTLQKSKACCHVVAKLHLFQIDKTLF